MKLEFKLDSVALKVAEPPVKALIAVDKSETSLKVPIRIRVPISIFVPALVTKIGALLLPLPLIVIVPAHPQLEPRINKEKNPLIVALII
jgi:hypothetical protein